MQWQPSLADPVEDGPWDAVGVAGGRRDEDRQVRRFDEAIRQFAIGVLDRVDVRRVDEDEPRLDRAVLDEPELRRQDAGEGPVEKSDMIVGMEEDDRDAGGRTQDAGLARGTTGDRVEDRALACSGRTDEHHQQRSIERCGPDSDVSGEMIGEARRASERGLAPWSRREATLGERLQPPDQVPQCRRGGPTHPSTLTAIGGRRACQSGAHPIAVG